MAAVSSFASVSSLRPLGSRPGIRSARALSTLPPADLAAILVVDDNDDNRMAYGTVLEAQGYRVLLAASGAEAIAMFAAERPDCVLLDVRMPDLDGFVVCERMRALAVGSGTPIIFVTGLRSVDTFDRALDAGGDDFLTKPVHESELVLRVQWAVELGRLSPELRKQISAMRSQRDAVVRLQLQKERLTAFLVHDLKSPVNAIDLHAQLLVRDPRMPEALVDSATQIRMQAHQLGTMVMDLLDLSKADEGQLSPTVSLVDVRRLGASVVNGLAVAARMADVELACDADIEPIVADRELLRRTLTNLVDNAIQHAPSGSRVTLSAVAHPLGTDFCVIDAGEGIAPELRATIFDPFVQLGTASSLSSTRRGRGLGLAFCRSVAEAHGGWIEVEDAAPGAVFRLRLPASS